MGEAPEVDVLVVGAGVGGLTVAAALARMGFEVGVVERSDHIGGSAALSEGIVWTAPDRDSFLAEDPGGDVAKFDAIRAEYRSALDDVSSAGVTVGPKLSSLIGFGEGHQIDIRGHLRGCRRAIEGSGGWILFEHDVESLIADHGSVLGARIKDLKGGDVSRIDARATVLATGGFQGSEELRAELIGDWARDITLRANSASAGDGLRLGRSVGAALSASTDGFYGHLIPKPLARWTPEVFALYSQYHSDRGVLVNRAGQRFTDESAGDHANNQAVARAGGALLFIDNAVWKTYAVTALAEGMVAADRVQDAVDAGANVSIADDLESLVAPVGVWGFDPVATLETLKSVQRDAGSNDANGSNQPPYALMEVESAITFTMGGLASDVSGRVLANDGEAIPGLWAVGVDAGGVNVHGYTGGLVRGMTLGRIAARAISNDLGGN